MCLMFIVISRAAAKPISTIYSFHTRCGGEGRVPTRRAVEVKIPAGVDNGNVIKLKSLGGVGRHGGAAGDLYLKVQVHPDELLVRRGQDLHSSVAVPLFDAMLGGRVAVATPRGERVLMVPEGGTMGGRGLLHGSSTTTVI